jgi:hypothetical protein
MICDRCGEHIQPGEEMPHFGQMLCEECYMQALSPARCDPWAVRGAQSLSQLGEGYSELSGTQVKMRKTVANLLVILMIVGLLVPLLAGCGPAPIPIVVEKEVPVEKKAVETVIVEKEVPIEKKVVETVIVEKEVVVPAPTPEPALTIIDGAGRVVTIVGTPQRIVSIASAATETLYRHRLQRQDRGCGQVQRLPA